MWRNVVQAFEREVQLSDEVICIGAGKRYRIFENIYGNNKLLSEKILCCVDNNPQLFNKKISFAEKTLDIWSMNYLHKYYVNHLNKRIVFLITIAQYREIYEEIRSLIPVTNNQIFFFTDIYAGYMENEFLKRKVPSDLRITEKPLIPRKIHYCWFGGKPLPLDYQKYIESWKELCPEYEIVRWDESNYDVKQNAYIREAYEKGLWAYVSDYARLDIIYRYGGIYLDTDVELVKSLDELLYQSGFIGFEDNYHVNTGLGFGAEKGLDIIGELRDEYYSLKLDAKHLITCPVIQTNHLVNKGLIPNGEYQTVDKLTILPVKVLCGMNYISKKTNLTKDTIAIHHFAGSWLNN